MIPQEQVILVFLDQHLTTTLHLLDLMIHHLLEKQHLILKVTIKHGMDMVNLTISR